MDLDQLKKILDLVREHELSELDLETDGFRLKVRKDSASLSQITAAPAGSPAGASHSQAGLSGGGVSRIAASSTTAATSAGFGGAPGPSSSSGAEAAASLPSGGPGFSGGQGGHLSPGGAGSPGSYTEIAETEVELAVVKSPIVGTFYRSSEPGSAPLVDVGSIVRKGQVLCIIEAMKLMNEIDSEYDGEIANVYVENGQPVQYGERLFAIKVQ
jgi:acetyl-CoA carboxylase biotin carboxyl carrier protein